MLAAFSGMEMENMTRNHGWRFLHGAAPRSAEHLIDLLLSLLARGDPTEEGRLGSAGVGRQHDDLPLALSDNADAATP